MEVLILCGMLWSSNLSECLTIKTWFMWVFFVHAKWSIVAMRKAESLLRQHMTKLSWRVSEIGGNQKSTWKATWRRRWTSLLRGWEIWPIWLRFLAPQSLDKERRSLLCLECGVCSILQREGQPSRSTIISTSLFKYSCKYYSFVFFWKYLLWIHQYWWLLLSSGSCFACCLCLLPQWPVEEHWQSIHSWVCFPWLLFLQLSHSWAYYTKISGTWLGLSNNNNNQFDLNLSTCHERKFII